MNESREMKQTTETHKKKIYYYKMKMKNNNLL